MKHVRFFLPARTIFLAAALSALLAVFPVPSISWTSLETFAAELSKAGAVRDQGPDSDGGVPPFVVEIFRVSEKLPETLPWKELDSAGRARVFPGWPGRVAAADPAEEHTVSNLSEYLDSKHVPGIFRLIACTGASVEFHYGTAGDAFKSLRERGASRILLVRRVTPYPATCFFVAEFPGTPSNRDGSNRVPAPGFVTGTAGVFGEERFDHLLIQARLAFSSAAPVVPPVSRILHRPLGGPAVWYGLEMKRAIDRTLRLTGGRVDASVIGFRGSMKNGILDRVWGRLILKNLQEKLGTAPFEKFLESSESSALPQVVREAVEELGRTADNRLPEDFFSVGDLIGRFLKGLALLEGALEKAGAEGTPVSWEEKHLLNAIRIPRPVAEKVFVEADSLDFLPHYLCFYRDRGGKLRSLLLLRNLFGRTTAEAVRILSGCKASKLAMFGSCGSLISGGAPGDVFLPAAMDLDGEKRIGRIEFRNSIDSGKFDIPIASKCFGRSVFSPLVETAGAITAMKEAGASWVDVESFHFAEAVAGLADPPPAAGMVLIASDAPGSPRTLSEAEEAGWDRVTASQKDSLPAIFDFLNLQDMVLPGEEGYPFERTGFFFGTFDPVHEGHLATAREAADKLGLSRVVMIPNHEPVHKPGATAFEQRHAMLSLAVADEPKLETYDPAETVRSSTAGGVTKVIVDVKKALSGKDEVGEDGATDRFYQVMGTDSFEKLVQYGLSSGVSRLHNVIVMARPGYRMGEPGRVAAEFRRGRIIEVVPDGVPQMSSTAMRKALGSGERPEFLKPAVLDFIYANGLYGTKGKGR